MIRYRLKVYRCKDGKDITDFISTRNGETNSFGLTTAELWHKNGEDEEKVGSLCCGELDADEGFRMEVMAGDEGFRMKIIADTEFHKRRNMEKVRRIKLCFIQ